jgi:cytochrome b561
VTGIGAMGVRSSTDRYGALAIFLHWLTVVLVLLAWLLGTFIDDIPKTTQAAGLFVHMTAGLSLIGLLVARVLWRLADPHPPRLETRLGRWGDRSAAAVQVALYALLLIVPALGITVQLARGRALPVFGLFDIASPWPADRALARSLKDLHGTIANVLLGIAALHAAAALFHHFVLRDRTLGRMLPSAAERVRPR